MTYDFEKDDIAEEEDKEGAVDNYTDNGKIIISMTNVNLIGLL